MFFGKYDNNKYPLKGKFPRLFEIIEKTSFCDLALFKCCSKTRVFELSFRFFFSQKMCKTNQVYDFIKFFFLLRKPELYHRHTYTHSNSYYSLYLQITVKLTQPVNPLFQRHRGISCP